MHRSRVMVPHAIMHTPLVRARMQPQATGSEPAAEAMRVSTQGGTDTRMHSPLRQHTNTQTSATFTDNSNAHLEDGAAREAEEQPGRQHWTEGRQEDGDGGVEERAGEEEYAQPHEDLQEGQRGARRGGGQTSGWNVGTCKDCRSLCLFHAAGGSSTSWSTTAVASIPPSGMMAGRDRLLSSPQAGSLFSDCWCPIWITIRSPSKPCDAAGRSAGGLPSKQKTNGHGSDVDGTEHFRGTERRPMGA